MSFGFRVCFTLAGEGSLTSSEEFISFAADELNLALKLSSGTAGVDIGKTDRFSISGGSFEKAEDAQTAAGHVRIALLRWATKTRRGIDLGQQALKGFSMSEEGRQHVAELLKVDSVQEDHLGITVFPDDPKPKFVRINARGIASVPAQTMINELSASIGRHQFRSERTEVASGIYAISHFVGRAPARFLLLFVSLEALFEPALRSEAALTHVRSLIEATERSPIPTEEREAIASALAFLRSKSIGQTGRDLAATLLRGQTYDGSDPATFFSRVYKMRNNIVHRGQVDAVAIQSVLGEMDRFVAELLGHYFVEP